MLLREYAKQNRQDMTSEGPKGGSLLPLIKGRAWRVILVHVPAGPRDCLWWIVPHNRTAVIHPLYAVLYLIPNFHTTARALVADGLPDAL